MVWYRLYISYSGGKIEKMDVKTENRKDLFAAIGYIYSVSISQIERIDYEKISEHDPEIRTFSW